MDSVYIFIQIFIVRDFDHGSAVTALHLFLNILRLSYIFFDLPVRIMHSYDFQEMKKSFVALFR